MLSRDEFCRLIEIASVEALKSRSRRGQLPVSAENKVRKGYGYSVFDAFMTIVADRLASPPLGMNAWAAAATARLIAPALGTRWLDIAVSAASLDKGNAVLEIEWEYVWRPKGAGDLALV